MHNLLYSPSAHINGFNGSASSGFFTLDHPSLPTDCILVTADDHSIAVNLPHGSTYSFAKSVKPDVPGTLTTVAPTAEHVAHQAWLVYQGAAMLALHQSDPVVLRCFEDGIPLPADWVTYRKALRTIAGASSGTVGTLPAIPTYPDVNTGGGGDRPPGG